MNWLSLLGLEGTFTRWRANAIEGAIAAEDRDRDAVGQRDAGGAHLGRELLSHHRGQ